jgi:hypothetical protein
MHPNRAAALRAVADAADALGRLARECATFDDDPSALVPLRDAARVAASSARVLREAIRAGDLVAYGGQRDRAVRRRDLDAWIESRRVPAAAGPDDADMERRMRRLAKRKVKAA